MYRKQINMRMGEGMTYRYYKFRTEKPTIILLLWWNKVLIILGWEKHSEKLHNYQLINERKYLSIFTISWKYLGRFLNSFSNRFHPQVFAFCLLIHPLIIWSFVESQKEFVLGTDTLKFKDLLQLGVFITK